MRSNRQIQWWKLRQRSSRRIPFRLSGCSGSRRSQQSRNSPRWWWHKRWRHGPGIDPPSSWRSKNSRWCRPPSCRASPPTGSDRSQCSATKPSRSWRASEQLKRRKNQQMQLYKPIIANVCFMVQSPKIEYWTHKEVIHKWGRGLRGRGFFNDSSKVFVIKRVRDGGGVCQKLSKILWRHSWMTPRVRSIVLYDDKNSNKSNLLHMTMNVHWWRANASMTRAVSLADNIPTLQKVWRIMPVQESLFLSSRVIRRAEL